MTSLAHELRIIQNPALGAVLLWRFATAYTKSHSTHAAPSLPQAFLVLPMIWHADTANHIASTRIQSGLRALAAKFTESRPSQLDLLISLNERAARWRPKTREALCMAFGVGLLRLGIDGGLIAAEKEWADNSQVPTVKSQANAAGKLGVWFSELSLREIAINLHIHF